MALVNARLFEVGRRKGLNVALITKIFPTRSATAMAQGGVNACLNNVAAEDTIETHTFDTVKVLTILVTKMRSNSSALVVQKAYLKWTTWVLHSLVQSKTKLLNVTSVVNLIHVLCYSADKTGHVILHTTYEQCLKEGVHFLQEWYL